LPVIYSPDYDCPEATTLLSTRKQAVVFDLIHASDLAKGCSFLEGEPATADQLQLIHTRKYVEAFLAGTPRGLAQSQRFDWSPKFARSVLAVNGGHLLACRQALQNGLSFHLASGAHHARAECGSDFCTFNYLAWCPKFMMQEGEIERTLIVDLDTHQGDGNWLLTRDDPRFRCFDISGCSMDVPPHHVADGDYWLIGKDRFSARYFEALKRLPCIIDDFKPDLIQFQAGMDCYEKDPMMDGNGGLTAEELARRDRFVIESCRERRLPLVVNLAGGYCDMKTTAKLHFQTFLICLASISGSPNMESLKN